MTTSTIKNRLKWKYRRQKFLAFSEETKECLWQAVTLLAGLSFLAYLGAHYLLWLTGYYDVSQAVILH